MNLQYENLNQSHEKAIQDVIAVPIGAVFGYLEGYAYGKLVDLPAAQCAKVWAIRFIAFQSFKFLTDALLESRPKEILDFTFSAISLGVFISEMTKRNLLGPNLGPKEKMSLYLWLVLNELHPNLSNAINAIDVPIGVVSGYLGGYVYGKLVNLPAAQCAKAWAVHNIATQSFSFLTDALLESKQKLILDCTFYAISKGFFISEMTKRKLLTSNMEVYLKLVLVINILIVVLLLSSDEGFLSDALKIYDEENKMTKSIENL